ncbi:MYND-type domain-containing protein [Mycena kentingensis (nom. inval.)]|nr:MYND-type domain-containing protein [Mycena kentingensis (nom. inval.)]
MDPSLQLSRLARLPLRHRVLANTALRGNPKDIKALSESLESLEAGQVSLALPVVAHFVQEGRSQLATLVEQGTISALARRIMQLLHAWELVGQIAVAAERPRDILVILDRLWDCASLIELICAQVPVQVDLLLVYSTLVGGLVVIGHADPSSRSRPLLDAVIAMQGSRSLFGRAWLYAADHGFPMPFCSNLSRAMRLFAFDGPDLYNCPTELSLSVGGDHQLALLVSRTLTHLYPEGVAFPDKGVEFGLGFGVLLRYIKDSPRFLRKLHDYDVPATLVRACLGLTSQPTSPSHPDEEPEAVQISYGLFARLIDILSMPDRALSSSFSASIDAGLLTLCFRKMSMLTPKRFSRLLRLQVPAASVFPEVLLSLAAHLPELSDMDPERLAQSEYRGPWEDLVAFVSVRAPLLRWADEEKLYACHNPECDVVLAKNTFRKCSGCLSAYYCGQPCQSAHYRAYNHRVECPVLRNAHFREEQTLKASHLRFLRTLLNYEYSTRQVEVGRKLVSFWCSHLHTTSSSAWTDAVPIPCVQFDFSRGACAISVVAHTDAFITKLIQTRPELKLAIAASANGGGKVWVHLVGLRGEKKGPGKVPGVVPSEKTKTMWLVRPMRCTSARLWDGLRAIALARALAVAEGDQGDINESVGRLVQECAHMRVAH